MVFQFDIYTTCLSSLGFKTCSSSTSNTILLIGLRKSLLLIVVSITFSWKLCTIPCKLGSVLIICAIGHLFLPMSSFSNTTSATWKFLLLIFHLCHAWRLWRNSFHQWDQNSPATCCTCLHRLREYRSSLLNTPGAGIITINNITVCSCHATYAFQSESTLYSCLNVKELLAQSRHKI